MMNDEQDHDPPVYFPEGTVPTLADLCAVCRREGLPQVAEALEERSLPCYSLEAADGEDAGPGGVMSKIGGVPDLPSTGIWPEHEGKSLSFIAQVNSDERTGMMWGDSGMLYFWIREEDLAARRFENVWTILQSG